MRFAVRMMRRAISPRLAISSDFMAAPRRIAPAARCARPLPARSTAETRPRCGYRLDHLRAVLDHAGFFRRLADDVAGRVLKIEERQADLTAGLDEVRRFRCAVGIKRPVVGDDADREALHRSMAAHGGGAIVRFEI